MNERILADDPGYRIPEDIKTGPFASPLVNAILRKFGKTAFVRSSGCMEFEHFLHEIKAGGECCLEIGTYHGITAIILSQYFRRVVCVSVDEERDRSLKYEIVAYLGIKNIQFHDVHNNAEKRVIVDSLAFDFAYSDGDHARDAKADFDLVKRCGRVLMHEYWPLQPAVWNLVNALPQDQVRRAHFDCFAYWERRRG